MPRRNQNEEGALEKFVAVVTNPSSIIGFVISAVALGSYCDPIKGLPLMCTTSQYPVAVAPNTYRYGHGWADIVTTIYYVLVLIVLRAAVQDFVFSRIADSSGVRDQGDRERLFDIAAKITFYTASLLLAVFAAVPAVTSNQFGAAWADYPQVNTSVAVKTFYILQFSFWLQTLPQLLLQGVTDNDVITERTLLAGTATAFSLGAYLLNFASIGIILLCLHYALELYLNAVYLMNVTGDASASDWQENSRWAPTFFRTSVVFAAASMFLFALPQARSAIDVAAGDFNTWLVRIGCLTAICGLQYFMMWEFTILPKGGRGRRNAGRGGKK